ncbi:hypothetical protein [Caballeronia sp. LZ001]|uniref:hypothetical protein n=1 Tax=Caballeronia sp. LZ001 TaxID=3038553 RepID=UPI00285A4D96|nr:hypothetical protein [Caballeronia sp. LZ001]MDR5806556.1 hypothetical protein [Caballeronia sp. LZ001]
MDRIATLRLALVRSADDEATFSPNYQRELREFYQLVRADRTRMSAVSFTMHGVQDDRGFTGEFIVPLAQTIGSTLLRGALAWRQSRTGRTLRMTFNKLEFDIGTSDEFEALLKRAQSIYGLA